MDTSDRLSLGRLGIEVASDTAEHTNGGLGYCGFTVLADANISDIEGEVDGTLTGFTIPAGISLAFPFTSITLASGKLVLYKGTPAA